MLSIPYCHLEVSFKGPGWFPRCAPGDLTSLKWFKTIFAIYNSGDFRPSLTVGSCWIQSREQETLEMRFLGFLVLMLYDLSLTFPAPIGKKPVWLFALITFEGNSDYVLIYADKKRSTTKLTLASVANVTVDLTVASCNQYLIWQDSYFKFEVVFSFSRENWLALPKHHAATPAQSQHRSPAVTHCDCGM